MLYMKYYFFVLQVLIPMMAYKGQKLIKLVKRSTAPITTNTIPNVPVIVWVKYRTANTTANKIRMILSALPKFFFILFVLRLINIFLIARSLKWLIQKKLTRLNLILSCQIIS